MRCLYREKKYQCGDYLEIDIFPVFEKQRGRSRKRKPTSEVQKRLNQHNAERKLIRLLNTNFTKRDIRFDLTYDKDHLPDSPKDAQRQMQNFIRRVKRYRQKHDLPELKYVAVTEVGEKSGRIHHHIVMSGGIDINTLARDNIAARYAVVILFDIIQRFFAAWLGLVANIIRACPAFSVSLFGDISLSCFIVAL